MSRSGFKAQGSSREGLGRKRPWKLTGENPERLAIRSDDQRAKIRIQCTNWGLDFEAGLSVKLA